MALKYRLLLVLFFLSIAVWAGMSMFWQTQQELLWGYLPLFLLLGIWGTRMSLSLGNSYRNEPLRWKWLTLSTLSGLLLWLGFPTFSSTPLMFIAFVPLLKMEDDILASGVAHSGRKVFGYSYHAFLLWNILSTFWVADTSLMAGIFANFANAFLMSLPFLLFHYSRKVMPGKLNYLAFIAYWLSFEYIHLRWELTWPWLTLGNSFAAHPSWVQWYEYTGVFGGGLWILLANVLGFKLLDSFWSREKGKSLGLGLQWVVLIVLPLALSLWMYSSYEEKGVEKEVVVVQPNYEPHYVKFRIPQNKQFKQYMDLAETVLSDSTDYLVFPESAFGLVDTANVLAYKYVKMLKAFLDQYPKLHLVTGLNGYTFLPPNTPWRKTMRVDVRTGTGDTIYWEAYNIAVQLTSNEDYVPVYLKSKLVPGAEIFPYYEYLSFLQPIVDDVDGTIEGNATQDKREAFIGKDGLGIGPVICYESIFGAYSTGYVKDGANALFIVTNDGWWDDTDGHRQHLQFASLRAIELRRSIARSANTGISAFINQRGDISKATAYNEEAVIKGTLFFNEEITFYVLWGDLIGRLAIFTAIILLLNTFSKRLIGPKK